VALAISEDAVKLALKANTEAAIAAGAFGVPTLNIDGELFWGFDATDYAIAYLREPNLLKTPEALRLIGLPASVARRRG
jgi:2-hydroxychromene-2-carboxylate isomerase